MGIYVYSGATGAGDGSTWADAVTSLFAATLIFTTAGTVYYIANDHVEAGSGATITAPLGAQYLCVNRAGSVPPVAADLTTGAKINTTGASNNWTFAGSFYAYGLSIGCDTSGSITFGSSSVAQIYENCIFYGASFISAGVTGSSYEWINCTLKPAAGAPLISGGGVLFAWKGGTLDCSLGTPTIPLKVGFGLIEGVDFSQATAASSICAHSSANAASNVTYLGCKLPSGVPLYGTSSNFCGGVVSIGADLTNEYLVEAHSPCANMVTETTIVRSSGANDGTRGFSRKITMAASGTSGPAIQNPFRAPPIAIWNDTTGSTVNVTVHGTWGTTGLPNNDDIWMEVAYFGDASSPKASVVSSFPANILTTHAAYSASGATWGGSAAGTPFKMAVAITPQKKGYIYVTVKSVKPSTTFYVDPLAVLS